MHVPQAHTAIAIVSWILFQICDPGVMVRSAATCQPLPPVVAERLHAEEPLAGLENQPSDDPDGSTYCVRCCLWRPRESHHCSLCQRCVRDFDEHCEILGGCVGGSIRGCYGNKLVHRVNIGNLLAAILTAAFSLLVTMVQLSRQSAIVGLFW